MAAEDRKKFRLRAEMIRFGIIFGVIAALTLIFTPVLGMANALVLANSAVIAPMSLSNDYTTKLYTNTAFFSAVYVSLGVLAWVANINVVLKGIVFFVAVLFLAYTMNRGKRVTLYVQFLINLMFLIYNPVTGMDLLVRLIILECSILGMMATQWVVNRNRYRQTVKMSVRRVSDEIEEYADKSFAGIDAEENERLYKETEQRITECSSLFFTKFDQIRQWPRGEQYLRLLSILKRLNRIIYRFNDAGEKMTDRNYGKVKYIIKSVDNFNFERRSFDKLLDDFGKIHVLSSNESEEELFVDEEIEVFETDPRDLDHIMKNAQTGFSRYRFLYSLKTAIMAAVGVMIIHALGLPYEYWFPVNVCILSQPFIEVSKKKSGERLLNTVVATGIVFAAFHITDLLWVHIVIMIAMVIFGDIFFKFNFFTLYAAFMALIMGNTVGHTSLEELTALRILYVAAASGVVLLVDSFFSTGKLRTSMDSLLAESLTADNAIMELLMSEDYSGKRFKQLFSAKADIARRIINMRAYYKDPKLDAFILDEQSSVRMYTAIEDYMGCDRHGAPEIMSLFRKGMNANSFKGLEESTTGRNAYVVYAIYDLYDTLKKSTELIGEMRAELK